MGIFTVRIAMIVVFSAAPLAAILDQPNVPGGSPLRVYPLDALL